MSDQPEFSLVVPTLGRTDEVAALLASIARSERRSYEVIVVDQNRDGRLDALCREWAQRLPLQQLPMDGRGAALARNLGARQACGRFLNFPDDDCELLPHTLDQAANLLRETGAPVVVGASVDRAGTFSNTRFATGARWITPRTLWGRCIEFTIFFERKTFASSGGFDPRFGVGARYGADEGPELLLRLMRSLPPRSVYYSDCVRFYHPDKARSFDPADIARSHSYARGSGALLAKVPEPHMLLHAADYVGRGLIGAVLYREPRRAFYRARVRGFVDGCRDYWRAER